MFDLITKEVANRFGLGDKSLPLVQMLIASMLNENTNGLNGFTARLKNQGLQYLIDSWTQDSAPLHINHTQIEEILGGQGGLLDSIQHEIGLDKGTALLSLAYLLPNLFKLLTQQGEAGSDISNFISQETVLSGNSGITTASASTNTSPTAMITPSVVTPISPVATAQTQTEAGKSSSPSESTSDVTTDAEDKGMTPWKHLFWLVPLGLGALLLNNFSGITNTAAPTQENAVSAVVTPDSAIVAEPVSAPIAEQSAPVTINEAPSPAASSPLATRVSTENSAPVTAAAVTNETPATEQVSTSPAVATENAVETATQPLSATEAKTAEQPVSTGLPDAKIYFPVSKTRLPADTSAKLTPIITYLKANPGSKVTISGFHDPTGDPISNETLAKMRANNVQAKLRAKGIAKNAIVMEKPQSTVGTGSVDEARRVEVKVSQ